VEVDWLAKLPFFQGIDIPLLKDIAAMLSTETCRDGDAIVREGEEGNKFYIIVRGKFDVMKQFPEGEKKVAALTDGDYFGEIALLQNIPRTATVRATGPSVLMSVKRETFHRWLAAYPQMAITLENALANRK
jgi:ATP-binding cassette subfamily B protein